jgi:hypothetical protein
VPKHRSNQVKLPHRCRYRSIHIKAGNQTTAGTGIAPDSRAEAPPTARRQPPGCCSRSHSASVAQRPHPPRWADVRARRNLTEQPTSRLCSADESVVTSRRCQRPATRSFHGLSFPLQGPVRSAPARRCRIESRASPEPKLEIRAPRPFYATASRRGVQPLGSLRRFTLLATRRSGGRDWQHGGPKPCPAATPFQRRGGSPLLRPDPRPRPKTRLWTSAVLPESFRSGRS